MKIIYNRVVPFGRFIIINLFGVLFVRKNTILTEEMIRHEEIHSSQMRELWYVGFYILYILEYMINIFLYGARNHIAAYRNISFEREAYSHQAEESYFSTRKKFAMWKEGK